MTSADDADGADERVDGAEDSVGDEPERETESDHDRSEPPEPDDRSEESESEPDTEPDPSDDESAGTVPDPPRVTSTPMCAMLNPTGPKTNRPKAPTSVTERPATPLRVPSLGRSVRSKGLRVDHRLFLGIGRASARASRSGK